MITSGYFYNSVRTKEVNELQNQARQKRAYGSDSAFADTLYLKELVEKANTNSLIWGVIGGALILAAIGVDTLTRKPSTPTKSQ